MADDLIFIGIEKCPPNQLVHLVAAIFECIECQMSTSVIEQAYLHIGVIIY